MKNVKGISLIALIITIIVIIILAAIVITMSLSTPDSANFAKFCSEIAGVQEAVTVKYSELYIESATAGNTPTDAILYNKIALGKSTTAAMTTAATLVQGTSEISVPTMKNQAGSTMAVKLTRGGTVYVDPPYTYNTVTYYNATATAIPADAT